MDFNKFLCLCFFSLQADAEPDADEVLNDPWAGFNYTVDTETGW